MILQAKRIQRFLWVILVSLILVLFMVLALVGCSESGSAEKKKAEKPPIGPTLEKMTARIYREGVLETILHSQKALLDMRKNVASLHGVSIAFYEKGKLIGNLSSDSGTMYLKDDPNKKANKNDIILDGKVHYKDKKGMSVRAPRLRYHAKSGKLVSGGGSFEQRLEKDGKIMVFSGSSFETDKDLKHFLGNKGRFQIMKSEPIPEKEQVK